MGQRRRTDSEEFEELLSSEWDMADWYEYNEAQLLGEKFSPPRRRRKRAPEPAGAYYAFVPANGVKVWKHADGTPVLLRPVVGFGATPAAARADAHAPAHLELALVTKHATEVPRWAWNAYRAARRKGRTDG